MLHLSEITEVSWPDIRHLIGKINPSIANLIDGIKPKQRHPLFLAKYPFGTHMVRDGVLMLPSQKKQLVPYYDNDVNPRVRELLAYSSIPLSMWLNSTGEVYVELDDRVIPLNVFTPGSICGLWETLDASNVPLSKRIWNIAVGARSLFMLPKIADAISFKRLEKKYNIQSSILPKTIFDHAELFSKLIYSKHSELTWTSDILFFSKGWFKECLHEKEWLAFHYRLLRDEWTKSIYWRNKVTFNLIGQLFAAAQASRNLKPNPYLIDAVMYLINIGVGASPSFEPIPENGASEPIKFIQKCIVRDYGLKDYIPTIMRPNFLSQDPNIPVYYSMQWPTLLGSSPHLRKPQSVLDDMRMVKKLLDSLISTLKTSKSPIFDLIKNVEYDFFHTEVDNHSGIKSTKELSKNDPRFIDYDDKNRVFCETSSFLRGCVRISRQKESR